MNAFILTWNPTRHDGQSVVGAPERGIVASGVVDDAAVCEDEHWSCDGSTANYISTAWDAAVFLDETLPVTTLQEIDPTVHWTPQGTRMMLDLQIADAVDDAWVEHVESLDLVIPVDADGTAASDEVEIPREYRFRSAEGPYPPTTIPRAASPVLSARVLLLRRDRGRDTRGRTHHR